MTRITTALLAMALVLRVGCRMNFSCLPTTSAPDIWNVSFSEHCFLSSVKWVNNIEHINNSHEILAEKVTVIRLGLCVCVCVCGGVTA